MTKKLLVLSFGLLVVLALVLVASTGEKLRVTPVPEAEKIAAQPPAAPMDACLIDKSNGVIASYFGSFTTGMANITYYNPVTCGFTPTYPFEITAFSFILYDATGLYNWPVQVDVVVYDLAVQGDSCSGPGKELCRVTVSCDQATFGYPNYGTVTFPDPCCVNGPFYAGIEYTDQGSGPFPSVLYDDQIADTCDNWFYYTGYWYEWFDLWTPPPPGYPLFQLHGETNSPNCDGCDWQPGDPHKMHYPQLPDEAGWDVNATQPVILADDWQCSETGWIKDFHFWGSWKHGIEGKILYFVLSIHSNIPAGAGGLPYSRPGETLWEGEVGDFGVTPHDPPSMEGWYDPATGEVIPNDHQAYFQYNVCLDSFMWFPQIKDSIYWLNISAILQDPIETHWGWKSSQNHFMDDAVWGFWGELNWIDLWEPAPSQIDTNQFWAWVDPDEAFGGGGTDHFGTGWYYYPTYDWWNIWFYDAPFSYDRYKRIHIWFYAQPYNYQYPSWFEFAVNWSTDQWSLDQAPTDSGPPLPGVDEDMYIGRHILLAAQDTSGYFSYEFTIPDYNPEWVSIDVRGYNFVIESGSIEHECVDDGPGQSLDLSFVVTGDAPTVPDSGACCYPEPTGSGDVYCVVTTQNECENNLGGTYHGNDTQCSNMQACCLPTDECVDADSMCCVDDLGGVPQGFGTQCTATEACCFSDGSCQDLDPLCCIDLGGQPQGPGSQCGGATEACCLPNGTCQTIDPVCCLSLGGKPQGPGTQCSAAPEACCMPNGTCQDLDPICCLDLGGTPQGPGTQCTAPKACCLPNNVCQNIDPLCCDDMGGTPSPIGAPACMGDGDLNGVDDACEGGWNPGDPHKMHYPQLPDEAGWDVNATYPLVLADDWQCSQTGWIKDFHFWGSWMHGKEANIGSFVLSVHSNIPEDQNPGGYSVPGEVLWERNIESFGAVPIDPPTAEGWYDPYTQEVISDDHQAYFQYNIYLDSIDWFWQNKDTVYWLNISAIVDDPSGLAQWGWKSSQDHFMDDAVWGHWQLPGWTEMYEPATVSDPILNHFTVEMGDHNDLIGGDGENAYGQGWYFYPMYEWWNIWFYDHPFTYDRYKTIHIEFEAYPTSTSPYLEIAVNWSTDEWSLEQPPADSAPPLPGVDEDVYIGREVLFASEQFEGPYTLDFEIPYYNPEWISIDVRGSGFIIPYGFIAHDCVGPQSLDLSFVVTGGEVCDCIPGDANNSGNHNILDVTYIISYLYKGGPAPAPYMLCSGDANCDCRVNILDITYIINYLYKGGNPPCDCPTWLSNCGSPLRK